MKTLRFLTTVLLFCLIHLANCQEHSEQISDKISSLDQKIVFLKADLDNLWIIIYVIIAILVSLSIAIILIIIKLVSINRRLTIHEFNIDRLANSTSNITSTLQYQRLTNNLRNSLQSDNTYEEVFSMNDEFRRNRQCETFKGSETSVATVKMNRGKAVPLPEVPSENLKAPQGNKLEVGTYQRWMVKPAVENDEDKAKRDRPEPPKRCGSVKSGLNLLPELPKRELEEKTRLEPSIKPSSEKPDLPKRDLERDFRLELSKKLGISRSELSKRDLEERVNLDQSSKLGVSSSERPKPSKRESVTKISQDQVLELNSESSSKLDDSSELGNSLKLDDSSKLGDSFSELFQKELGAKITPEKPPRQEPSPKLESTPNPRLSREPSVKRTDLHKIKPEPSPRLGLTRKKFEIAKETPDSFRIKPEVLERTKISAENSTPKLNSGQYVQYPVSVKKNYDYENITLEPFLNVPELSLNVELPSKSLKTPSQLPLDIPKLPEKTGKKLSASQENIYDVPKNVLKSHYEIMKLPNQNLKEFSLNKAKSEGNLALKCEEEMAKNKKEGNYVDMTQGTLERIKKKKLEKFDESEEIL